MNEGLWHYDRLNSAVIRYVKNKVFAAYGYPFKSALMRPQS